MNAAPLTAQPVQSTTKPKLTYRKRKGPWLVACATTKLENPEKKPIRRLPWGRNPMRLHFTLESAAKEAERLGGLNPAEQFAIFECIGNVEVAK